MTKYKYVETTTVSQKGAVNLVTPEETGETYLSYNISELAQQIADITGKPVEVDIVQTILIEPTKKAGATETAEAVST